MPKSHILSKEDKEFLFAHLYDMTYQEMADELGCKPSTIRYYRKSRKMSDKRILLAPIERAYLLKHYRKDKPTAEICEVLGITPKQIYTFIYNEKKRRQQ